MILTNVKVPDFRVLKNIELNFNKDFPKKIFPLGSFNGGGKSTLLQLIFILLHCSCNKNRIEFVKNLFEGLSIEESEKEILHVSIEDPENDINANITFFASSSQFLDPLKEKIESEYVKYISFSSLPLMEVQNEKIELIEINLDKLNSILEDLNNIEKIENQDERASDLRRLRNKFRNNEDLFHQENSHSKEREFLELFVFPRREINTKRIKNFLEREISENNAKLKKLKADYEANSYSTHEILEFIKEQEYLFLTTLSENNKNENGLLCKISMAGYDKNLEEKLNFLNHISSKVYLAAPSTQVFLFLDSEEKRLLLKNISKGKKFNSQLNYFSVLDEAKSKLDGLFT